MYYREKLTEKHHPNGGFIELETKLKSLSNIILRQQYGGWE